MLSGMKAPNPSSFGVRGVAGIDKGVVAKKPNRVSAKCAVALGPRGPPRHAQPTHSDSETPSLVPIRKYHQYISDMGGDAAVIDYRRRRVKEKINKLATE
jgi:hypothetical protein